MANGTVIIGIHGLNNKPPAPILADWWHKSIMEGLKKNLNENALRHEFDMVYWAGIIHSSPLLVDGSSPSHELYNDEPYKPAEEGTIKRRREKFRDKAVEAAGSFVGESLDTFRSRMGLSKMADVLIERLFDDLHTYYQDKPKQEAIRNLLKEKLLSYKGHKIMLIAHSMGSIIAYDVLTLLGQSNPDFEVDHFVTIGSPLGLRPVKGNIISEFNQQQDKVGKLQTPSVVSSRWVNYADRRDPVALDARLSTDYEENARGVKCEDDLVYNDYRVLKSGEKKPDRNYHKSYGYLRTPEFSDLIAGFK